MKSKYVRFPISVAIKVPTSGEFMVVGGHYWVVDAGDLLFFRGQSPQCNVSQKIAERLAAAVPSAEVRWLKRVFVPIKTTEFYFDVGV
jgi:hypothetical protein